MSIQIFLSQTVHEINKAASSYHGFLGVAASSYPGSLGVEDLEAGSMGDLCCNPRTGVFSGLPLLCAAHVGLEKTPLATGSDRFPSWPAKKNAKFINIVIKLAVLTLFASASYAAAASS